jgi:hypothetical protein
MKGRVALAVVPLALFAAADVAGTGVRGLMDRSTEAACQPSP